MNRKFFVRLLNFIVVLAMATGAVTWNSYELRMNASLPQGVIVGDSGVVAECEFYESANDNGVAKGALFAQFNPGAHPESPNQTENWWGNVSTGGKTGLYPYVGKSTLGRGLGPNEGNPPQPWGTTVRDIALHPPDNQRMVVVAFIAPSDGQFTVSSMGAYRGIWYSGLVKLFLFDNMRVAKDSLLCQDAWVTSPNVHTLDLKKGDRVYFGVHNSDGYRYDATRIAFAISGSLSSDVPRITLQPADQITAVGGQATMRIAVSGTGPFVYRWIRNGRDTVKAEQSDSLTSQLLIKTSGLSDSASYVCEVSNAVATTISKPARLSVEELRASFTAAPLSGKVPLMVDFSSTAQGEVKRWIWGFGDSSPPETTLVPTASKTYQSPGIYTVSLRTENDRVTDDTIMVGLIRVDAIIVPNSLVLTANPGSPGHVVLAWNDLSGNDIDSIRFWWSTTPIADTDNFPSGANTRTLVANSASDTVKGLLPGTRYYFAAQVGSQGFWSGLNERSIASSLVNQDTTKPSISIESVRFDSLRNALIVGWTAREIVGAAAEYTITAGTDSTLANISSSLRRLTTSEGIDTIELGPEIRFLTRYYVRARIRSQLGEWSLSAVDTVSTGAFSWHPFDYPGGGARDFELFNGSVRLRFSQGWSAFSYRDTLCVHPLATRQGLIPVGLSVRLKRPSKGVVPALQVGIRVDSLPGRFLPSDALVYRDSAGVCLLETGRASMGSDRDSMVWLETTSLNLPFALMIDTLPPVVRLIDPLPEISAEGADSRVDCRVSDNVRGARVSLIYGSADTIPLVRDSVVLSDTASTVSFAIPALMIDNRVGTRGMVVVTDGKKHDTTSFWRRVARSRTDSMRTAQNTWVPFMTTSVLDSTSIAGALRPLIQGWSSNYDKTQMRLFRWIPSLRPNDSIKWVEYVDSLKHEFSLIPGRLMWIKTKTAQSLQFGRGVSVPLDSSYVVALPPRNWTDLTLPWRFNMKVGDLLSQSGSDTLVGIFKWESSLGTYATVPVYMPSNPLLSDKGRVLMAKEGEVYSLYNGGSDTVRLSIAPIAAALSRYSSARSKSITPDAWSLRVDVMTRHGERLAPLYFGHSNRVSTDIVYPRSPTFQNRFVGLYDRSQELVTGHTIRSKQDSGGTTWELAFCNSSSEPVDFLFSIRELSSLPKDFQVGFAHAGGSRIVQSRSDSLLEGVVTVGPYSQSLRTIMVGDATFIANRIAVGQIGPTLLAGALPMRSGGLRIRYRIGEVVPRELRFSLISLDGRMVWRTTLSSGLRPGWGEVVGSGDSQSKGLPAGTYVLRMSAHTAGKVHHFQKRVTYASHR